MRKIVLLDDHFATGEQTIQPVLLWGPGRNQFDTSHVTKTASEALDYVKNVTPEPGKTHMLVLALGGEESYGPNRNGDGFPERPVNARNGQGYWIAPGEGLKDHYQTFETNPAHAFLHHQNKDPKKASGQVKKAFWNGKMHRVELLIIVDNKKDPEWVQRVNDGDFPAVSMGCRIKYDVCSICGNKAPTRAEYCDHVRNDPGMNQIMPDGRKAYVHNPSPNFFDISRVFRPADRTGYTLKKVAHIYELRTSAELGETADSLDRKSAAIRKLSDIDKIVRGEPVASSSNLAPDEQTVVKNFKNFVEPQVSNTPALPMSELLAAPPMQVLSTLHSLGIQMTTPEFMQWYASAMQGHPTTLSSEITNKVAAFMPAIFDLYSRSPALLEQVIGFGLLDIKTANINPRLQQALASYVVKRAGMGEQLYRRLVPEGVGLRHDAAPNTDMLTAGPLQTTRGAAIDAQDAQTNANMKKMLGGGALMLGGYKLLGATPGLRLPAMAGAGYLGYKALQKPTQQIHTDQGLDVNPYTEFAVKGAAENMTGAVIDLIDNYSRAKFSDVSLFERVKNASWIDGVRGLDIDFETVAQELGTMLVR